jgi:hypothetical protein
MKRVRIFYLIWSLFVFTPLGITLFAQNDKSVFTVSGLVKDKKTNRSLEYVNISVKGSNVGTITNADGTFLLKIKRSNQIHTLEISSLGYITAHFSVEEKDVSNKVFSLDANAVRLKEVEVMPVDAKGIVAETVKKISLNYSRVSSLSSGFYRETVQKGKRYISISEAVTEIYKSPYRDGIGLDRVKIFKGRKLLSARPSDTLAVKIVGGPTQAVFLDIVKNPDILLNQQSLPHYNFSFNEFVNIEGRLHYVISFQPAVISEEPFYDGVIFIDRDDLTISRVEFNLSMLDKDKVTRIILRKKPAGLRFTPVKVSYLVTYKRTGDIASLNYVRSEIKFKCDWKRRLFATTYSVVSEVAITDRIDNPQETIPSKETFRIEDVLSDKVANFYDDKFWGNYNIIEPTESLEKAVGKLKKENK